MDWTALVTQVPLVTAFIWYALQMQERGQRQIETFMSALEKRDVEYERRNAAIVGALTELSKNIANLTEKTCAHDEVTREAIQRMDGPHPATGQKRRATD